MGVRPMVTIPPIVVPWWLGPDYCQCGCHLPLNTPGTRGPFAGDPTVFCKGHGWKGTLLERFYSRIQLSEEGCQPWTGFLGIHGYGEFGVGKKLYLAHRLSWELHYGPIPDGMQVCHKCDFKPCTRKDHFFLGTFQDNMEDKIAKGRQRKGGGKLSEGQVREIRRLMAGGKSMNSISILYGVTPSAIQGIRDGRLFRWVK